MNLSAGVGYPISGVSISAGLAAADGASLRWGLANVVSISTGSRCAAMDKAGLPQSVAGLFALAVLVSVPFANAQSFLTGTAATISSSERLAERRTASDLISKMIEQNHLRNERLRNYSALRRYQVINPDGKISAEAVVREEYHSPGQKEFQKISEDGNWLARHFVFDREMQTEEITSSGPAQRDSEVSQQNYNFTIVREEDLGAYHCYVVRAEPKRADKLLFEGELWIDANDFGIVKISGHPAGKMSLWINGAEFVREFQKIDGFWLPFLDETTVDLKMNGKKVFRIEHQQYVLNATNTEGLSLAGFSRGH
jgi:hypothetical protein